MMFEDLKIGQDARVEYISLAGSVFPGGWIVCKISKTQVVLEKNGEKRKFNKKGQEIGNKSKFSALVLHFNGA